MIDSSKDKIGRQPLVDKIKYLIDTLPQDEHFCLALDGEWGSGKTFVMEMLQESLKEPSEYIVINYDAWKNNFYSDPLIAILYCLLDGIKEYISLMPEVKEKVKKGVLKSIKTFGKDTLSAMKNEGGKIALFAHIVEGITNIVMQSGRLESHQKFSDFRSYQSLLDDVKKQLNDITAAKTYEGKQTKLVIMVDEIDRCLPNEQLIILERLHHLFDVKNCVTIIAMNQSSIAATVHTLYGIKGFEYLRNFFEFTFKLQPSVETYFGNLLNDILERISKIKSLQGDFVQAAKSAYDCLLYGSNEVMRRVDNRDLKRYSEAFECIIRKFGLEKLNPNYLFFIIIALFVRKFISHTFLESSEIFKNQQSTNERIKKEDSARIHGTMPYFDYLHEYIGIDRQNLPDKVLEIYKYSKSYISEYSWYFNEIIIYSTGKMAVNNEMRVFENLPKIIIEDCKQLVELVVLYGGEQERDTPNEKQRN